MNIELTKNKKALVSPEFEYLNQFKWHFDGRYATRTKWNKELKKDVKVYMHKEILNVEKGEYVDHVNGDKLDNRLDNLRKVTSQQNSMNMLTQVVKKHSKYKGVSYDKSRNKWVAYCVKDTKMHNLGRFTDEKEAALAYNEKAKELFGEFARLNKL
jgi:hypothetical protein